MTTRVWIPIWTTTLAALVALGGCTPKQQSTLEEPAPQQQPDTSFEDTPAFGDIDTTDEAIFREAQLEAELERKVQETLQPVYFEFNSYQLSQDAIEKLVRVGSFLMEYNSLRVVIEGHCDERGSSEYNMGLGENRARVVRDYLLNYGVPAVRLETTSWGEERLARSACTDEACHGMNRRAEFKVLQR
ncbi:MAG: OmpA family protein [Chitinivibrionales bacterium]|nr:OmpA family protein [Chitinivibrionales bacterium]